MKVFSEERYLEPGSNSDSRDLDPVVNGSQGIGSGGSEYDEKLRARAREIVLEFPISEDHVHKVVALLKSNT